MLDDVLDDEVYSTYSVIFKSNINSIVVAVDFDEASILYVAPSWIPIFVEEWVLRLEIF